MRPEPNTTVLSPNSELDWKQVCDYVAVFPKNPKKPMKTLVCLPAKSEERFWNEHLG